VRCRISCIPAARPSTSSYCHNHNSIYHRLRWCPSVFYRVLSRVRNGPRSRPALARQKMFGKCGLNLCCVRANLDDGGTVRGWHNTSTALGRTGVFWHPFRKALAGFNSCGSAFLLGCPILVVAVIVGPTLVFAGNLAYSFLIKTVTRR